MSSRKAKPSYAGPVVLVTGGAVRVGRGIACRLAAAGFHVVVHYRRSSAEAQRLLHDARRNGWHMDIVRGSLDSARDCYSMFRAVLKVAGPPDILINNAASFEKDSLATITERTLLRSLKTNLAAPLFLMRAFAKSVEGGALRSRSRIRRRQSMIINILDARIVERSPDGFSYSLSKHSLATATAWAAVDLAPIAVNAIAPGPVLRPARVSEPAGPKLLSHSCNVDDVVDAVMYLVQSKAVTGQIIYVDSGRHILPSSGKDLRK